MPAKPIAGMELGVPAAPTGTHKPIDAITSSLLRDSAASKTLIADRSRPRSSPLLQTLAAALLVHLRLAVWPRLEAPVGPQVLLGLLANRRFDPLIDPQTIGLLALPGEIGQRRVVHNPHIWIVPCKGKEMKS